ncbi:hypothetical protein GW17_00014067 [Ensete ventricosum]|nr:hypothetical protein GW17_00014067 [Ensete ventricosum]RZS28704.1 hypothetical protein BHM03_00062338 [Ensete ventricosum]
MASPHPGPTTHNQAVAMAPCKGTADRGRPTCKGQQLAGEAACRVGACGHDGLRPARRGSSRWQHGARKGLPPVASPTASRGGSTAAGVAAPWQGNRRLRRGSDAEGARGKLGYPFVRRTILPL